MSGPPLLTVAIPTFNGARHLTEALRSILAQEGADFDLIVSDDRSEDDTLSIVRSLAGDRVRVSVNAERLGLAGNWNRCVELARTPWVNIFHQDDVMRPGHLFDHAAAILGDTDGTTGLIISSALPIGANGGPVANVIDGLSGFGPRDGFAPHRGGYRRTEPDQGVLFYEPNQFIAELAVGNPVRCSAVTLSRAAHSAAGGFDPSYRYAVDWDFWLRVARGWWVIWYTWPSVTFRWHSESETHRFKQGTLDLDEQARLLHDLYTAEGDRLPGARRLRRAADRRLSRAFLNRAYEASKAGNATLARHCLRRSVSLWPGIVGRIAFDPRLAARLAAVLVAPRQKARRSDG